MPWLSSAAWIFLAPLLSHAGSGQEPRVVRLPALRNAARPLLIFAPRADDPRLVAQLRTLQEHAEEMRERDVLPVVLPWSAVPVAAATLAPEDAAAARRRFHVAPTHFVVVLIGKDGGEKLRSPQPLSIETLNQTIDAMPMRQDEMRGRNRPK